MNVSFAHLVSNSFHAMKERLSIALSPLQKKVALVVVAFFSCLAAIAYFSYNYRFKATTTNQEENHLQPNDQTNPLEVPLPSPNNQTNPLEVPFPPPNNQTNPLEVPLPPKVPQDLKTRLEKNRKIAQEQQKTEGAKNFAIKTDALPETLVYGRPLNGEQVNIEGGKVGVASCQGIRPTMEDADIALHSSFSVKDKSYPFDLLGVFDGHGGKEASAFVKANIATVLEQALANHNREGLTDDGIFAALRACFQKLDADYTGYDGTTATVAVILDGKIWVANAGDSRTILVNKNGAATQASEDAKPQIERYRKKIEKLGGYVDIYRRVQGVLAVARAIGDKGVVGEGNKCCVSANPKVTCYSLEDFKEGYLVLACDGLYDVATTNEVGAAIKQMADQNMPEKEMAQRLVYSAIANKSKDNVSAMVIKL